MSNYGQHILICVCRKVVHAAGSQTQSLWLKLLVLLLLTYSNQ